MNGEKRGGALVPVENAADLTVHLQHVHPLSGFPQATGESRQRRFDALANFSCMAF